MLFILTREAKLEFKCKIELKPIIFFKSKLLQIANEVTKIPIKVRARVNEDRNLKGKKNEDNMNLRTPNKPNFTIRPANNNDTEVFASQ